MIFHQFLDGDLGCACYLVGDEDAGVAVVVDPPYAVEPVLAEAERRGLRLVRVIETHTHADHVSGHGRLALEHGIPISIHADAGVEYSHDPMRDGDEIEVGAVALRVIHTPGHRPEHCCLSVIDRSRAGEPWLVLTGDSLFVGDAARPDLAVGAVEGAEGLFSSLGRLMELADGVEVFPGHVAGSLCGKAMSSKPSTTIGFERRFNPALQFTEVDAFIADAAAIVAPKPPNLARIVELNRGPFLGAQPAAEELAAPPAGTQLLDVRPVASYLAGHRPGAVNVPVAGTSFATKAGFVLDGGRPVTVLAAARDEAEEAVRGLRSVAFLDVEGYVLGAGEERVEAVAVDELEELMAAGAEVIDVREKDERDTGYIPGSRNVPYRLMKTCCPDMPTDRPVVTICESGARAAIAASILRGRGYDARPVVEGGMAAWRARGGDTIEFRRCGSG
ncbi:Metallo-beta-lactamase superfamily [Gaiella occulta]|uniref:Metallo-beta-lactamase superfamily n=1 Tax=Gaiella occulta TaxID=1002870 RepID=A0A7M2YYX9_9ACTN|nr:MBL fold metallo-hydrolase [Gaiella occulta]RDI75367.1 Metallo-beta-lactamase superfamily [Gaiella occulta]